MKPLTEREEEVMRKLWAKGDEAIVREILELFPEPKPHFNTLSTFLRILEDKGWVTHRKIGNTSLYRATVTEEEMGRRSLKSIATKFFNGSLAGMVSALLKEESLDDNELKELMDLINNKSESK